MKEFLLVYSSKELSYLKHFKETKIVIFENTKYRVLMEDINQYSKGIITRTKELDISKIIIELDFNKYTVQENKRYNSAILLATILRLDGFLGDIFLIGSKDIAKKSGLEITTKSYEVLKLNVASYLTEKEAFQSAENESLSFLLQEIPEQHFDFDNFVNGFELTPTKDRHQSTNEWGALKLALNSGYTQEEIDFSFPESLFFKFLQQKLNFSPLNIESRKNIIEGIKEKFEKRHNQYVEQIPINKLDFNELMSHKKVLLIDDNADKGWQASLENIFNKCLINVASDFNKVLAISDYEEYDIVFIDLYMPDPNTKKNNKDISLLVLKSLKETFAHVPIIVFTASNKSWTLDEVLDLGADGMYVKESPENATDEQYSLGNFKSFVQTIWGTLLKYQILRPYWNAIQKILKDQTFLSLPEKGSSNFKSRIEERLMMFYGLLKRGFEQTEFNEKQFHFSDYELAFMTLWSVLNEISEANYNKSQPNITIQDSAGSPITNHPDQRGSKGQPLTYLNIPNGPQHYKWQIVGQDNDVYVEYEYGLSIDRNTGDAVQVSSGRFYKLNHEQKSCFLFENKQFKIVAPIKTNVNYENILFLQIAFLIERKVNLSISSNKSNFQQSLVRLRDVRNHLYLTHGSDISSGFYNQTEKAKRVNHTIKPNRDIKDLFELISFLLTGKGNNVDIM